MGSELLSIASVVGVSLVSFIGLLCLSLDEVRLRRLSTILISFAAGSLLGDAFIHFFPSSFSSLRAPLRQSLLVLGGIMAFFMAEKFMRHRHGAFHVRGEGVPRGKPELAAINLIGDAVHNFIDGILIGASYLAGPGLGVATTMAVLFHEIPQELGDFSILIHSGLKPRKAILLNFASGTVAIIGTVCALLAGSLARETVVSVLIPVTAGGFVYLALADLLPELQHDRTPFSLLTQTGLMALGIAVMALLAFTE
jgi:zinc and cadmium transporter